MSSSIPDVPAELQNARAVPAARFFARIDRTEIVFVALCLTGALLVTLPHSPANVRYVWLDAGVFLYVGQRLLEGQVLYRDVWDHKPPLIYYVNALGLGITNGSRWGVWFLEYTAVAAASVLSYKLLQRAFGRWIASSVTAIWLLTFFSIIEDGNLTETFALPFQFACLLLAYDIETNRAGIYRRRGFLLGILLGLLFFFKTNQIGVGLAIGAYLLFKAYPARNWRGALKNLATILAGFLLVTAGLVILFLVQGNLYEFWQAAFVFNVAYAGRFEFFASRFGALAAGYEYLALTGLAVFGISGFAIGVNALVFARERIPPHIHALLGLSALAFPIELVLVTTSGRPFDHYFAALLYIFAVWTAWLFYLVWRGVCEFIAPISRQARRALAVSLLCALFLTLLSAVNKNIKFAAQLHAPEPPKLIELIRQNTTADDTVLVFGHEARVLFFAGRRAPTRFIYQSAFEIQSFASPALLEEYWGAVVKYKPKYILDPIKNGLNNRTGIQSVRLRRLLAKVRHSYKESGQIDGWNIYQRVSSQ